MAKRFGKRVFAIEYEHDRDGGYYRHDFTHPTASLVAENDKTVSIKSRAGLPLWGEYLGFDGQTRIMLENPRGRKMKRKRKAKAHTRRRIVRAARRVVAHVRRRLTSRRKAVRKNPIGVPAWVRSKGFSSWGAYMASIRPTHGAHRGGGTVARKRRRSTARRRTSHSAPRRRRRRRSFLSNPFGLKLGGRGHATTWQPKSLIKSGINGAIDGVTGTVGLAASRFVRGKIGLDGNTIKGSAVELLFGIGAAPAVAMVLGDDRARAFVQGVFMGPIISTVKSKLAATNPLAVALGDEGELPLFGGLYELGGTYDVGNRTPIAANGGLGGESIESGMM